MKSTDGIMSIAKGFLIIIFAVQASGTATLDYQENTLLTDIKQTEDDCETSILSLRQNSQEEGLPFICQEKQFVRNINCLCRQESYIFLQWDLIFDDVNTQSFHEIFYEVEKLTIKPLLTNNSWTKENSTTINKIKIDNLSASDQYQFRITPYLKNIQLGQPSLSDRLSTFEGNETLQKVKNIRMEKVFFNDGAANALIEWDRPDDAACETMIAVPGHFGTIDLREVVAENHLDLEGLSFESSFSVMLYSTLKNVESDKISFRVEIPSCLDLTSYNYILCGLMIPIKVSMNENCEFEINLDQPPISIHYYLIKISEKNKTEDYKVDSNATHFKLNITDNGLIFIELTAFGSNGKLGYNSISKNITCKKIAHGSHNNKKYPLTTGNSLTSGKIAAIFIAALITPIIILIIKRILICFYTSNKEVDRMQPEDSFRKVASNKYEDIESEETNKDAKSILEDKVYDEYEVNRHHVRICQVLGEGEFGVVYKAIMVEDKTYHKYVAVKTLRNKESAEEKRQLEKEIEVMKSVGKHRNIVSLLGCCTEDMMLIVEYCSQGDLRRFLRRTWRIKTYAEEAVTERNNTDLLEQKAFSNMLYENSALEKRYLNLSMMDLLSFARQIALGMVYLSENRVVHRDLAARNVLLADDMTAKIADFGLSRDVYEQNIYMKSSSDRLPLRWMALESLQYQIFSTKSDVWSYGILLWEIMTLGGCPYPSLQTSEMYKLLQKGYRMERPKPCTPLLYEIMLSCWDAKPQNRPNFSQLVIRVEEIMKNESNRSYLDLTTCNYKTHLDKGCDIKQNTYLH